MANGQNYRRRDRLGDHIDATVFLADELDSIEDRHKKELAQLREGMDAIKRLLLAGILSTLSVTVAIIATRIGGL